MLAIALVQASAAKEWALVAQLAWELEARRQGGGENRNARGSPRLSSGPGAVPKLVEPRGRRVGEAASGTAAFRMHGGSNPPKVLKSRRFASTRVRMSLRELT